jgi:hypothetical protein
MKGVRKATEVWPVGYVLEEADHHAGSEDDVRLGELGSILEREDLHMPETAFNHHTDH